MIHVAYDVAMKTQTCECGCGTSIPFCDARGRCRSFVIGHVNKGRSNWWKQKLVVLKRTSHERAVKLKKSINVCEWAHIGGCKGIIDVAHIDGDHFNNADENIVSLCRCHHRLMDHGRIDPKEPVMPEFVIRGGKRRYLYSYTSLNRSEAGRQREARKRQVRSGGK